MTKPLSRAEQAAYAIILWGFIFSVIFCFVLYKIVQADGPIILVLLGALIAGAVCFFSVKPSVKAFADPFIGLSLGVLPHTLFVVLFNLERGDEAEPRALDALASRYEEACVHLHEALEPFERAEIPIWVLIFLGMAFASYRLRNAAYLKNAQILKVWASISLYALTVASSLTIFSQVSGGTWSDDVRVRILHEHERGDPHNALVAAEETLLAHLKADHSWMAPAQTALKPVFDVCQKEIARTSATTNLCGLPFGAVFGTTVGHDELSRRAFRDLAYDIGKDYGSRFRALTVSLLPDVRPEASTPREPDDLNTLRNNVSADRRLREVHEQTRAAIISLISDSLLKAIPEPDLIREFADALLEGFAEKLGENLVDFFSPAYFKAAGSFRVLVDQLSKKVVKFDFRGGASTATSYSADFERTERNYQNYMREEEGLQRGQKAVVDQIRKDRDGNEVGDDPKPDPIGARFKPHR